MYVSPVQAVLLIDIQIAYINTKHEDFVGFTKWATSSLLKLIETKCVEKLIC